MQLIIPKTIKLSKKYFDDNVKANEIDSEFIYNYLPGYIRRVVMKCIDTSKLANISKEFEIDSFNVIQTALSNIRVSETTEDYTLKVDNNVNYNGQSLELLLNIITYGNRSVQGYPIIDDIFKMVAEHLESIYEEWRRK